MKKAKPQKRLALHALLLSSITCLAAKAGTWPSYMHDSERSCISSERLPSSLSLAWIHKPVHPPSHAWGDPPDHPVEGLLELPRMRFDDTFHVVSAGGTAYFASSSDNKVYALNVENGHVSWEFFTGGPVRLPPALWDEKLYAGSDDGKVYCLRAKSGELVWSFNAAPSPKKMLGNGAMISMWPVRTGVLVEDGTAYFGSGVFPAEGVSLYAADAQTGEMIWENNSYGRGGRGTVSPQGYMLASNNKLFVPSGRSMPAAFDRKTGSFLFHRNFNWRAIGLFGGTYSHLSGEVLFNGTEQMLAVRERDGTLIFTEKALKLVPAETEVYTLTGKELICFKRKPWLEARAHLQGMKQQIEAQKGVVQSLKSQVKGNKALAGKLKAERNRLEHLLSEYRKWKDSYNQSKKWQTPCASASSLVLSEESVFAGGDGEISRFKRETGKKIWSWKQAKGKVKGISISNSRIFASTDKGLIYCFHKKKPGRVTLENPPINTPPVTEDPFESEPESTPFAKAAELIIKDSGVSRGYCLVTGCENSALAYELSKRTELFVYVVEPDPSKVRSARKAFSRAGLYGKRVVVENAPFNKTHYQDYFANLIVCNQRSGSIPLIPSELFRMLKPCGGVAYAGRLPGSSRQELKAGSLKRWCNSLERVLKDQEEPDTGLEVKNLCATIRRGRLKGAGSWTHQYADTGRTACSNETRVRGPLEVLWFGAPGPFKMPSRHAANVSPLALNGRVFTQGREVIMAHDAYNGLALWERRIPGAQRLNMKRECSNLACGTGSIYLAAGSTCLRLDAATGETRKKYSLPYSDKKNSSWGYVARSGDLLFGTRSKADYTADMLFALDVETGKVRWIHKGNRIMHSTLCIGDGRVYFVDREVSPAQRKRGLSGISHKKRLDRLGKPVEPDVRLVVALKSETGETVWERPQYVADCVRISKGGGELSMMYSEGVVLICGQPWNGHFWEQFFQGEFSRRSLIALKAEDGGLLWSGRKGYRSRPVIIGDKILAEPWMYELKTGKPIESTNPVTGSRRKWQMARPGHHCGCIAASPNALFFRSLTTAWYDLKKDYGTAHFGAQRPGCWINFIPANGVVMMPEASCGCVCPFSIQCTLVFKPAEKNRVWGMFSSPGPVLPVKHLALNLGAPGDRRAADGTLWLAYPRPYSGRLVFDLKVKADLASGKGFYQDNAFLTDMKSASAPWIYASGAAGTGRLEIPLTAEDDPPAEYDIVLHFTENSDAKPGDSAFSVNFQGGTVIPDLDLAKEAGGTGEAFPCKISDFIVQGDLVMDVISKHKQLSPGNLPVLNGIEIDRTRILPASMLSEPFVLSKFRKSQQKTLTIVNHSNKTLSGELEASCPESFFRVGFQRKQVRIQANGQSSTQVSLSAKKIPPAGEYRILYRLNDNQNCLSQKRVVIKSSGETNTVAVSTAADTYVHRRASKRNYGKAETLLVDGGAGKMGDSDHAVSFLRFPLDIPGRPLSASLRLRGASPGWVHSSKGGAVYLVEGKWSEKSLLYEKRPHLGRKVAVLGKVEPGKVLQRKLKLDLAGRQELCLALSGTTLDGTSFVSREGGDGPKLIVEFGPFVPKKE